MGNTTKTLEERTECRLFSQRCIEAVARYQYRLPEPPNWPDHDDAVDELRFGVVDLAQGNTPAVIGSALGSAVNDLIQQEPEIIANMLGFLGLVLDSELLHREQLEHTRRIEAKNKKEARPEGGPDDD